MPDVTGTSGNGYLQRKMDHEILRFHVQRQPPLAPCVGGLTQRARR